ncbi:helix-turn-helix domain-containing protein [Streptomyces sp. NPDC020192]|uniref:helix-turn-helix domain-containing protein n=1 Tax=Streptomyces sp. NPDC020192 TaxID=3365066 RepID=UPI0037BBC225
MNEGGFGAHLRARRSRAGLTQEELAERSGLSVRSIRDLEHGRVARPRRQTLRLLATALGLPEDEGEELLRLARQALPPALAGPVDAELPTAPATTAPHRGDDPHPAAVPPDEPDTLLKDEASGRQARHGRGRRPAARYFLLAALLTVAALSSDHDPLSALPSHHGPSISQTTNRGPLSALPSHHGPSVSRTTSTGAYAARIGNLDVATPEGPSFIGTDLPVLHAVARGQTLIVTVALTGAGSGAVTVSDTAGNTYRPAGQINVHGRLQLFAVLRARPLDTLDRITIRWPRATVTHITIGVDAFRGITAAGPWADSELDIGYKATDIGGLTPCSVGDLLFIAVNASTDPAPQFDAPWRETPWQPVDSPPDNPTLTTAYRSITSTDDDCTVPGTATPPWQSITLRLHAEARPSSTR